MKFAIINDTHVGPLTSGYHKGVQRKLVSESERLVKDFVKRMNNEEHPEFVIHLGDLIEDVNNKAVDIQSFKKIISLLTPLKMPIKYLIGNHDIRTLTEKDISELLGYNHMYYSFDYGAFHFVALSFEMTGDHTRVVSDIRAAVYSDQVSWIKNDLSKTNKPTIIFIHYGLIDDDMKGNFWFESESHFAVLRNNEEIRNIFEKSGKVKAVISAHQHWNKMHVKNGIPYFIVTSMVENFNNDGVASEAYSIVELDEKKIVIDVRGNDPAHFKFNFK